MSLKQSVAIVLKQIHPISKVSTEQFTNLITLKTHKKGDVFIKTNQTNMQEILVFNGFCRSFVADSKGESNSVAFFSANSVLTPHVIRTENNLSLLSFEALSNIEIGWLDAAKFLQLMIENVEIREMANTILRNELKQKLQKEIDLATLSAKQRLQKLRTTQPNLENVASASTIASYLGITTISLSRLRGELTKG